MMREIIPSFYIIYGNQRDYNVGVICERRPSIPSPSRAIQTIERPGNTPLTLDLGYWEDIDITVEYNFHSRNPNEWNEYLSAARRWLLGNQEREMIFSDDLSKFYIVKGWPVIGETEREIKQKGHFDVTFTCEGLMYLVDGKKPLESFNEVTNIYTDPAQPTYIITGEGMCTLTVNGKTMTANVGQNMTIDTKRMIAYRTDNGEVNNTEVTGDYEDMVLQPGENTITVTNGFDLQVIPNWRTL